jgi:hypothetical protein
MPQSTSKDGTAAVQIDEGLLHATIKLNTWLLAGVCGGMAGLFLLVMTYLSFYLGGENTGHYLNLLGVFFPGYNVSPAGAWIGLFWRSVAGAVAGAVIYRIYARSIRQQVQNYLDSDTPEDDFQPPLLRIGGHYLGLALGLLAALGLLVTTNWLVLRGTAQESIHAVLLANYLPGYTVSFVGSLIGAAELFAVTYLVCLLLAGIYNLVATRRTGRALP